MMTGSAGGGSVVGAGIPLDGFVRGHAAGRVR